MQNNGSAEARASKPRNPNYKWWVRFSPVFALALAACGTLSKSDTQIQKPKSLLNGQKIEYFDNTLKTEIGLTAEGVNSVPLPNAGDVANYHGDNYYPPLDTVGERTTCKDQFLADPANAGIFDLSGNWQPEQKYKKVRISSVNSPACFTDSAQPAPSKNTPNIPATAQAESTPPAPAGADTTNTSNETKNNPDWIQPWHVITGIIAGLLTDLVIIGKKEVKESPRQTTIPAKGQPTTTPTSTKSEIYYDEYGEEIKVPRPEKKEVRSIPPFDPGPSYSTEPKLGFTYFKGGKDIYGACHKEGWYRALPNLPGNWWPEGKKASPPPPQPQTIISHFSPQPSERAVMTSLSDQWKPESEATEQTVQNAIAAFLRGAQKGRLDKS